MKRSKYSHYVELEDVSISLLDGTIRDSIVSMLTDIFRISAYTKIDTHASDMRRLKARVELIFNEMVSNIFKYEKGHRFAFGYKYIDGMFYLHVLVNGNGLNKDKVLTRKTELENMNQYKFDITNHGKGYYNCIVNSDLFDIRQLYGDKFKKVVVFGFTL